MTLAEHLASLDPVEQVKLLCRLEGMELAMRICRTRAMDANNMASWHYAGECAELIRIVQVQIGAGAIPFPELTKDEQMELARIEIKQSQ